MLQARRLGKALLLRRVDPRQSIEISRQPAVVLGEQVRDKGWGSLRTRSHEAFPAGLRPGASRNHHAPRADTDLTAIEVEHRRERQQGAQSYGTLQDATSLDVRVAHRMIQAGYGGVIE